MSPGIPSPRVQVRNLYHTSQMFKRCLLLTADDFQNVSVVLKMHSIPRCEQHVAHFPISVQEKT